MSRRVFDLRDVGNDEAEGVRQALATAGIEYYETPARILFGAPAIFVADEDFAAARQAVDAYQQQWRERAGENTQSTPILRRVIACIGLVVMLWLVWQFSPATLLGQ
ncbi:MAG: hypothetical protein H6978_02430 [Gammaproteobacteria bacterium]|nr:hypothetical protein [Gammaproteobacteria bacterium]